jgi:hypothetical protein
MIRISIEIIASCIYILSQVVLFIGYYFGTSVLPRVNHTESLPPYIATIFMGYIFCFGALLLVKGRAARPLASRVRFDCFLVALPVAAIFTIALLALNLPIRLSGWNAHGFGISDGAANVIFFPWLHGLMTITIAKSLKGSSRND